jgi:sugar O-acyltransferase (sialic acid O-acetyltransferase NeuD family)
VARQLLLLGAGGLAREVAEAVEAANGVSPTWELLGYLDDDPALTGGTVGALPVLGPVGGGDLAVHREAWLLATVASPADGDRRRRLVRRVEQLSPCASWATMIHPRCELGTSTTIGRGSVLLANVVATSSVEIGRHVVVMPGTILTHDDRIGDYVTIASGVRLGGGVRAAEAAYIGAGALVREGVSIGAGAVVGMGAVVLHDVPAGEVWAGNPARCIGAA